MVWYEACRLVCSAKILVATSSSLMPSIESSIVCVIALVWVWRSVADLIDACAPAKSAWMSWIDCVPGTRARFWAIRWFSAATCALALGSVADVVTAANTATVCSCERSACSSARAPYCTVID